MSNNVAEGHAERTHHPFTPLHTAGVDASDAAASTALLGQYSDARHTLARSHSAGPRDASPAATHGAAQPRHAFAGVADATVVSGALLRITDALVRRVLPWNAVCCPRAVESLRDLRIKVLTNALSSLASLRCPCHLPFSPFAAGGGLSSCRRLSSPSTTRS